MTILLLFFFNDTATTEIYTLSLHDALPIYLVNQKDVGGVGHPDDQRLEVLALQVDGQDVVLADVIDRKSTRLNSSHSQISYAVFCLKKKKKKKLVGSRYAVLGGVRMSVLDG